VRLAVAIAVPLLSCIVGIFLLARPKTAGASKIGGCLGTAFVIAGVVGVAVLTWQLSPYTD
jgi:hypothetical protein